MAETPFRNVKNDPHAARLRSLARHAHRPSLFHGAVMVPNPQDAEHPRWRSSIRAVGRSVRLGTFPNARTAGIAYDLASIALGFPPVNFTEAEYRTIPPEGAFEGGLRTIRQRLGLTEDGALPTYRQH